ncbi:MAG: 23S rRNA (adenine(2503)-C(2))-methyltransferase RlmN [bacterium]|nr:23S rRNA (adenine(2503)-C(2))-methyltransferase RlmN [bacterium]
MLQDALWWTGRGSSREIRRDHRLQAYRALVHHDDEAWDRLLPDEDGAPLRVTPVETHASSDGQTSKWMLALSDGIRVETVLMRHLGGRQTACLSTQAGCAMACTFCATGQGGLGRHLTSTEILEQALFVDRQLRQEGKRLTNVVLMGMGEPFHAYERTRDALELLADDGGLAIARRRITVSTVGLVDGIRAFAHDARGVNLALSLHAADDETRDRLMPVNRRHPIPELMEACRDFTARTRRRIFIEYLLLAGINDDLADANRLAGLLRGGDFHVNLIPWNPVPGAPLEAPTPERVRDFHATLRTLGLPVTVRRTMGADVHAACGQLVTRGR